MAIRHVTLVANVATQVSVARDVREVGVIHKGNVTNPIYVRADGTTAVVKANDTYTLLSGQQRWVPRIWSSGGPTLVSIISAGAADVEVEVP